MSPNLPRQDLKNARPRSLFATVAITLLILLGLYVLVMYFMEDSDPDRPPIIISSGSVTVASGGDWVDEGSKAYRQDFKGKSVKTFSAATGVNTIGGPCSVEGKTIIVTYGSNEITFTRKRKSLFSKYAAFGQFPADANVSHPAAGQLLVTTDAALVSFRNENGNSCNVQGGTLTIQQKH
jgi:hypothetical protein